MEHQRNPLAGSLNSLMIFEVAERCQSLTAAAKELNLTQPNVSRHVSQLEERLGCALFYRNNNKITVTEDGRNLAKAIHLGFGHVETVWREIENKSKTQDIVLACSYGFADQWLLPRFEDLQSELEGIRVRVVTSDWIENLDLSRIDVVITNKRSDQSDRETISLGAEIAFPVCSPDYLSKYPDISDSPNELLSAKLLRFDVGQSGFLTWESWFARFGITLPDEGSDKVYDAYPFLLRAAANGEGVALGWDLLVDQMVECGELIKVGPSVTNLDTAYYLTFPRDAQGKSGVARLVDWFKRSLS